MKCLYLSIHVELADESFTAPQTSVFPVHYRYLHVVDRNSLMRVTSVKAQSRMSKSLITLFFYTFLSHFTHDTAQVTHSASHLTHDITHLTNLYSF